MGYSKLLLGKRKLAFVDIETTGLDPMKQEIIEIGIITYSQKKDKVLKKWVKKIKPKKIGTANKYALKINGYNENKKLYVNDIKDTLLEANKILKGCILVGQNISFDISFIKRYMLLNGIEPSYDRRYVELMGLAWPKIKDSLKKMSLEELCNHFGISNNEAHSALVDCERSLEVYRCLIG